MRDAGDPIQGRGPDVQKVASKIRNQGVLYVVSTPIGNLEDITRRALRVLQEVDIVAAENITRTRGLWEHYGIKTRLTSYHQHNQRSKGPELVEKLKAGADVALVTDAGTPGISDPGAFLIHLAVREGIQVSPVPGPSAVVAALSISGLPTERFVFLGFLPNKSGKRKKELRKLTGESRTMVLFEAPHRLKPMLMDLREVLGDRQMVLLREMTKIFEEVKRGTVSSILQDLRAELIKGEVTLVVAGSGKEEGSVTLSKEVQDTIARLLADEEASAREIAARISKDEELPFRLVYRECLRRKKVMERLRAKKRDGETRPKEKIKTLRISNDLGLHARAAAKIVDLGKRFQSALSLRKDNQEVDGGSILSILTLSCPKGSEIQARIVGEDAEVFMRELTELFEHKFREAS